MTTDELLQRWSDGSITTEELRELTAKLAEPEHHGALLDDWLLESSLPDRLTGASVAGLHRTTMTRWTGWLSWRPITAAAAGIMFGMLCTSVVFGYVMPRAAATVQRLAALVDGSFEKQTAAMPSGFPTEFGVWSGHDLSVVEKVAGEAVDGEGSLRLVRCERGPCAVYQLIDLRSLRLNPEDGEARLVLSARFRDGRAAAGATLPFFVRLYVFSGSPDSFRETWPESRNEALSSGANMLKSRGGSPQAWQELSAKALLPPGADFALVHIGVYDPKAFPKNPGVFGEQFVDDVQLTLQTQPELPVRVAER